MAPALPSLLIALHFDDTSPLCASLQHHSRWRTLKDAGSLSFKELLLRVKGVVQGAMANADVPFARIVAAADIPRSSAYTPVFQNMVSLQTEGAAQAGQDDQEGMAGLKTEPLPVCTQPDSAYVQR